MIAEVTPIKRLPQHLRSFDYNIPRIWQKKIISGSLVRIPFRRQAVFGIVTNIKKSSAYDDLKEIVGLLPQSLTKQQLLLLDYLSNFYFLSPATLASLFAPVPPKNTQTLKIPEEKKIKATATAKVSKSQADGWFIYDSPLALTSYIATIVKNTKGQTLIVVPEVAEKQLIKSILPQALEMPPKAKKNAYWQAWVKSQKASIVLGGFKALWLPFSNLKQVVIVASENLQFHQGEQNPRIHLSDIINNFKQTYGTNILLTTTSPNIQLYYTAKLPQGKQSLLKPNPTIVDLNDERNKKNFRLLSETAQEIIAKSKQPILLYLNKHDTYELQQTKEITSQQIKTFEQALKITGTKKLADECQQLFPAKKIVVYSNIHTQTDQQLKTTDIVIATSKILSTNHNFKNAIMVNADLDLLIPDFQATQNLRRQIKNLTYRSDNLIIQTQFPTHLVFTTLNNFKAFYQEELKSRQIFNYPPIIMSYAILIKADSETEIEKISNLIVPLLPEHQIAGKIKTSDNKKPLMKIIIRGQLDATIIDTINNNYYNNVLIEVNPYNWT